MDDDAVNYPVEFMNSLTLSGFPSHVLELKVGVPIILMRNIKKIKKITAKYYNLQSLDGTRERGYYTNTTNSIHSQRGLDSF